jgi:hypothetical protein
MLLWAENALPCGGRMYCPVTPKLRRSKQKAWHEGCLEMKNPLAEPSAWMIERENYDALLTRSRDLPKELLSRDILLSTAQRMRQRICRGIWGKQTTFLALLCKIQCNDIPRVSAWQRLLNYLLPVSALTKSHLKSQTALPNTRNIASMRNSWSYYCLDVSIAERRLIKAKKLLRLKEDGS